MGKIYKTIKEIHINLSKYHSHIGLIMTILENDCFEFSVDVYDKNKISPDITTFYFKEKYSDDINNITLDNLIKFLHNV